MTHRFLLSVALLLGTQALLCQSFLENKWAMDWADSVLATLTFEEQIGQLLMPPVYNRTASDAEADVNDWVAEFGLGGVICMQGDRSRQRAWMAELQSRSKVPLLVSSDAEWGAGMRLSDAWDFPYAMTIGAARDTALTRQMARLIGQDLLADGVQVNFAPVVDVNSNPANPVIGVRSFGEDTLWVSRLGVAYALGLEDVGVMATAKHFPGHGDTDSDSHKTLPQVLHDRARLDRIEFAPFRAMIEAKVPAMMVAHLEVPALDSTPHKPSTLSALIVDSLLRGDLGFRGLTFTDALSMKGFADYAETTSPHVDAVLAGNDVLLFPGKPADVLQEFKTALTSGRIDSTTIAQRAHRILQAKAHYVLGGQDGSVGIKTAAPVHHGDLEALHRDLIAASLTVLKGASDFLPLVGAPDRVLSLTLGAAENSAAQAPGIGGSSRVGGPSTEASDPFAHSLGRILGTATQVVSMNGDAPAAATDSTSKHVFLHLRGTKSFGAPHFGVTASEIDRAEELAARYLRLGIPLTTVVYGSPYLLDRMTRLTVLSEAVILAYHNDPWTAEAVAAAVTGAGPAHGRLPVSSGGYEVGEGASLFGHGRLGELRPHSGLPAAAREAIAQGIDSIALKAISAGAMPGCRVVICQDGHLLHDGTYGTLDGYAAVRETSVYDLASVTKVAATTLCLMHLSEEGKLRRGDRLDALLPDLARTALGKRTMLEILSHQAGLTPWIPFYAEALEQDGVFADRKDESHGVFVAPGMYMLDSWQDSIWERIIDAPIKRRGNYKYSDLGFILSGRIIERLSGAPVDELADSLFYRPMGLASMGYRPINRGVPLASIAPTENDQIFRGQQIRGHVHDPGAAMLGGAAGHAGLFTDAHDMARLMMMVANGGMYGGGAYLEAATVLAWTAAASDNPEIRRGSGWDRASSEPDSGPTCNQASWDSFGHSGFTGTMTWVDPAHDLIYVFLSNRVFPDADNWKLVELDVRTEIQRVVYESLGIADRFESQHDID
jgi:beta-N-acetylhexosaminidase